MAYPYRQAGCRLCALLFLWASLAWAIPQRAGWVTDDAKILRVEQRQELEHELQAYAERTGYSVSVVLVSSLENRAIEEYAREIALAWNTNTARQKGALLLLSTTDRRSRIETAPSVARLLTDEECARILEQTLRPGMRTGDPANAITESVHAIQNELTPPPPQPAEQLPATVRRPIAVVLESLLALLGALLVVGRVVNWRASRAKSRQLRTARVEEIEQTLAALPDVDELNRSLTQVELSTTERQALKDYEQALRAAKETAAQLRESTSQEGFEEQPARDALLRASNALRRYRERNARGNDLRTSETSELLKQVNNAAVALETSPKECRAFLLPEEQTSLRRARERIARIARLEEPKDGKLALSEVQEDLQGLARVLEERKEFFTSRAERIQNLDRELKELKQLARQAAGEQKNLARRFPGENLGAGPETSLTEAQEHLSRLKAAPEPTSAEELAAQAEQVRQIGQILAKTRENSQIINQFIPHRTASIEQATRAYRKAIKRRKEADTYEHTQAGEQLLREADSQFIQGKKQLDLRERGNASAAEEHLNQSLALLQASEPHRLGAKRPSRVPSQFSLPLPDSEALRSSDGGDPDDLDAEASEPYGWGISEENSPGEDGNAFGGASGDW